MQIQTFSGKVISTEVVKSYTDFQNASTSKTVDILTLTTNSVIVGLEIDLNPFFGGIDKNHLFLSVNNDLVINKNISSPTQLADPYKNLIVEPSLITAGISPYTIQATVISEGNGGWSFSGNLNFSTMYAQSGFGIQAAAVCFGGYDNTTSSYKNTTEEYNGSNWTVSGTLSQGRSHLAGCGSILAGLSIGGWIVSGVVATCEEYNGASWSAGGNLNIARHNSGSAGTQIAGLSFGGYESKTTEEYNGTSWTLSGDMNVLTEASGGCGIQTDALSINGTYRNSTEEYNGTSWAVSVNTNFGRYHSEGCGTSSQALSFNGASTTGFVLETELFDGISWNIGNNSNIKRDRFAGCGTQSAAAQFGGQYSNNFPTITENWDKAPSQNLTNLISGNLTFKIKYINYNA